MRCGVAAAAVAEDRGVGRVGGRADPAHGNGDDGDEEEFTVMVDIDPISPYPSCNYYDGNRRRRPPRPNRKWSIRMRRIDIPRCCAGLDYIALVSKIQVLETLLSISPGGFVFHPPPPNK